jgi:branched-chain amino acid transport system permease protein
MRLRIALSILGIVLFICLPWFMPNNYYIQVLILAIIYTIAAMGLNFIYGFTGYISFAQAAFLGIGAYTTALLTVDFGWPPLLSWIAVIVVSAVFGVLLGIPSLRLKGHYLAMATIGFTIVLQMILMNWSAVTHGAVGVNGIPSIQIGSWKADQPISFYYIAVLVAGILFLLQRNILRSKLGRSFLAIREDEIAASSTGVNLTRTKVFAFALSAIYGGLAGALYAQFSSYISPDTFSFDQSIVLFSMVLIGGSGTLLGPVVGGILLTFLPEALRFVKEYYMAIYGLGIFCAVLFMPKGIVPILTTWWEGRRRAPVEANKANVVETLSKEEVV